jgi:alanyl-tRNA synthetase
MPGTERLYYGDSLLSEFQARVVAHGTWNGAPSLILDRTAFYPESGGQMADRGTLAGLTIADVQVDDAGVVHHLVAGALPKAGTEVEGTIDRARRRVHMALHTGQHMLSRALADVARGETVSSRLGETSCTIDIDRDKIDERDVGKAEDLVNAVVDDDAPVRAFFPEPGELATLPLRRQPKVTENIRVVAIGEFDVSPCGGTHCLRSGQVGLVRVTGVERYKGKIRISFASGRRARDELWAQSDVIRGLSRELTCGPPEVPAALAKLRRELTEAREALGQARTRLAAAAAAELIARTRASAQTLAVQSFDGVDADFARAVAKRLATEPGLAAIIGAAGTEGTHVVVVRGPGVDLDCGALLKRLAASCGGRGGGNPDRAEGKVPPGTDLSALVANAPA